MRRGVEPGGEGQRRGIFALFGLLVAIPWIYRIVALGRSGLVAGTGDLRGFVADVIGAGLAVFLALVARRLAGRWTALVPSLAWAAIVVAAHEQVRSLGTPLSLGYAEYLADPIFLAASVLHPRLLAELALALLVAGLGTWWSLQRRPAARALWFFLVPSVAAAAFLALPERQDVQAWRQTLLHAALPAGAEHGEGMGAPRPADLDAPRWREPFAGRPDVLLVVLEGVSGGYLPSVASAHGRSAGDLVMPELDAFARSALTASSFVTEQRQTNRGFYALLCGQSPRLQSGEARLTAIARGLDHPPCLPELLGDAGYRTIFFKASPLPFMLMDAAMPRLGFDVVADDALFEGDTFEEETWDVAARNQWGVDDATFFAGAAALVERLDEDPTPFFLTLFTAGTHHPYDAVPADYESPHPRGSLGHAMSYLDDAVGELLRRLEGRSRDTILVVTTDESAGLLSAAGDLDRELSQNWGVLSLRLPEPMVRRLDQPILQSDVALSLLDVLGLAEERAVGPGGRSLFRDYAEERVITFANTYQRRVSAFSPSTGTLLRCAESLEGCEGFESGTGALFGGQWTPVEAPGERLETPRLETLRRALVVASGKADAASRSRSYPLAAAGWQPVPTGGARMIFGGQYLEVPAGSRVTVELAGRVEGESGWLHVRHGVSSHAGWHYRSRLPVLAAGDSFELSYSFRTAEPLENLDARMLANALSDSGLRLRLERARLEIRPEAGNSTDAEVLHSDLQRETSPPVFRHSLETDPPEIPPLEDAAPLRWRGTALVSPAAENGALIPGPRFYAPAGSELVARGVVEVESGSAVVRMLLGSEEPSLLLAAGEAVTLEAGERKEIRLRHGLNAALDEVVSGISVESAGPETTVLLRQLEVDVVPP